MSNKTKSTKTTLDQIGNVANSAGLVLMTAAVTMGMIEIPEHLKDKMIVPNQPAYAQVSNTNEVGSTLRREKEETGPHFVSYNAIQRTAPRTGKR